MWITGILNWFLVASAAVAAASIAATAAVASITTVTPIATEEITQAVEKIAGLAVALVYIVRGRE